MFVRSPIHQRLAGFGLVPFRRGRRARRPPERTRARFRLEGLEDRCLLSPTITEFPIPIPGAQPVGITEGPNGNLWFADPVTGSIGMINPTTDAITEFQPPPNNYFPLLAITTGPGGNLWFTDGGAVLMFNPTTGGFTEYAVPYSGARLFGITTGPDGNV